MLKNKKQEQNVGFQTTSLVDVLFILLVFFLMVSQIKSSNVPVQLPKVEENRASSEPATQDQTTKKVVITIAPQSKIYLDDQPIQMDPLKRKLAELWRLHGKKVAVQVRTDEVSQAGDLVRLMNCLSEVGFEKIDIAAKTK